VEVSRSARFYIFKMVIPQISMALLSIIPYYMNPECGERLGFCIVLILTSLFFRFGGSAFPAVVR